MCQRFIVALLSCALLFSSLAYSQQCAPCTDCPACACNCDTNCETNEIIKSGAIALAPYLVLVATIVGTLGLTFHHYGGYKTKKAHYQRLLLGQQMTAPPPPPSAAMLQSPRVLYSDTIPRVATCHPHGGFIHDHGRGGDPFMSTGAIGGPLSARNAYQ